MAVRILEKRHRKKRGSENEKYKRRAGPHCGGPNTALVFLPSEALFTSETGMLLTAQATGRRIKVFHSSKLPMATVY